MLNFETVIGIEIHIELNTKTKMFSSAANDFNASPNTNASFVDLAYPGTLPQVNAQAVKSAIKLAKAFNMKIDNELHFDRKNYFYTDLPKGYQITQLERPIGTEGTLPISNNEISIQKIQLEEDTARSNHDGEFTALDYNRAGTPLIEIVSHPVIRSKEEAIEYIDQVRRVVTFLGISDAKMEEGSLRADINISLRPHGSDELFTRVEVKNLNSLTNASKAIDLEVAEQTKKYLTGEPVQLATKRFDEASQKNITMRVKMEEADYRFFPDPNIPVIALDKSFIDNITIGEMPWEAKDRLAKAGVDREYITQLINDIDKLNFINTLKGVNLSQAVKLYFAEVVAYANKQKLLIKEIKLDSTEFLKVVQKQEDGEISGAHVKKIIPMLIETDKTVESIIKDNNLKLISDEIQLTQMLDKIIENEESFINENKDRPERVLRYILGQLMKESKGQANPVVATKLVKEILGK